MFDALAAECGVGCACIESADCLADTRAMLERRAVVGMVSAKVEETNLVKGHVTTRRSRRFPLWGPVASFFDLATVAAILVGISVGCDDTPPDPQLKRDVFLLLVDTLRADHLSVYGYERDTSPNLQRFAGSATVFEEVFATAPWTLPSVGSIMTGLYPSVHGLRARARAEGMLALRPALTTLAEALSNNGYRTVAVVTNPFVVAGDHGLARGFEEFIRLGVENASRVNEIAREIISNNDPRPLFLYLHYMDPHGPYDRHLNLDTTVLGSLPADSKRMLTIEERRRIPKYIRMPGKKSLGAYIEAYDQAIRAWDESFGDWIDWLDARTSGPRPLVTVIADHGEEFADHGGWNHGETLFEEQLSVPWVLRLPGRSSSRVSDRVVSLIDVAPTILSALGVPIPETMTGINAMDDEFPPSDRPLFAETEIRIGGIRDPRFVQTAVRRGNTKHVQRPSGAECYDLAKDRSERRPSCAAVPWHRRAAADIERWTLASKDLAGTLGDAASVVIDEEQQERLRAIGYME